MHTQALQYRKRPIVIEAMLYDGQNIQDIIEWANGAVHKGTSWNFEPYVETLEGRMVFAEGEYIIKGIEGEFYPCKPDIFTKTYEVVNNG